jgi:hypothetical protein
MKSYNKWTYTFLFCTGILAIITATFNYITDSAGIFHPQPFLINASRSMLQGKIVAGLINFDERKLQEIIIKENNKKMDFITLGSSRSLMLRKRYFLHNNVNYFNHSLSGDSLEDLIGIVGIYKQTKGYIPKHILITIDPWLFNANNGQNRWRSIENYYFFMRTELGELNHAKPEPYWQKWERKKQLINAAYTFENIRDLANHKQPFYLTTNVNIDDYLREPDGSINYPFNIRHINPKQAQQAAIAAIKNNHAYSLNQFNQLANTAEFENFIRYLIKNKINISFYLPVYQPDAYALLITDPRYQIIREVENYIRLFAAQNDIKIYGSYDPNQYHLTYKEFFDDVHGHEIVYEKIFSVIPKLL